MSDPSASTTFEPLPVFRRATLRGRLAAVEQRVLERARAVLFGTQQRAARTRRTAIVGGAVLLVAGAVTAFLVLRPVPKPDYETAGLDDLFNYTLLTDEFNQLPVQERMRLIGQLVQRLKNMEPSESLLLASFAAGIEASAREQIEENGSRLAVDAWDMYAKDYDGVPEGEREQYLESTFVEFSKMMEAVAGEQREVSDAERINEMRSQVKEDMQEIKDPERRPDNEQLADFMGFMNNTVASRANAQQRVRGQQMMRDMVRHFRGQDIATGKPRGGG